MTGNSSCYRSMGNTQKHNTEVWVQAQEVELHCLSVYKQQPTITEN